MWLELRPYQKFEYSGQLESVISKINEFAIFFLRHSMKTAVIVRVNDASAPLFFNIDGIETVKLADFNLQVPFVKKLSLARPFYEPFATEFSHNRIFETLEQTAQSCVIAVYAKRSNTAKMKINTWIVKKERRKHFNPKVDAAKKKASEKDFFDCEVYVGAEDKELVDFAIQGIPKGIEKAYSVKPFQLKSHTAHRGFFAGDRYPVLCGTELHCIIALPKNVEKLGVVFGRQQKYTHGQQVDAEWIFQTDP